MFFIFVLGYFSDDAIRNKLGMDCAMVVWWSTLSYYVIFPNIWIISFQFHIDLYQRRSVCFFLKYIIFWINSFYNIVYIIDIKFKIMSLDNSLNFKLNSRVRLAIKLIINSRDWLLRKFIVVHVSVVFSLPIRS